MAGLSAELHKRCRDTLTKCHEFQSDSFLRSVFVVADLRPFAFDLKEAITVNERVGLTLSYLSDRYLSDGRLALCIFLATLRDRYQSGDALRDELDSLCIVVDSALHSATTQRQESEASTFSVDRSLAQVDPIRLRKAMRGAYSRPELEILIKDMGLDFHDLPGEVMESKIMHLIDYFRRRERYAELVEKVLKDRPNLESILW